MNKRVRTRYAPSPTGFLHIGGARTALFSYLFAKHYKGDFIVRTEDTDVARNVEGGEDSQLDNLEWLGIKIDESARNPKEQYGAYRQSEKLDRYNAIIEKMLVDGSAYKAYDSSEELDAQRAEQEANGVFSFRYDREALKISDEEKTRRDEAGEFAIRLALPKDKWYSWKDIVRGKISVNTTDIGDFVIKKQDGYPTYNFAVVVDDHDMEITHVLRGEEHTTNTPKQLAIYELLGWEAPEFGHLTIITNMEGKKLSKRDTSLKQFIQQYKDEGYAHKSVFNFLALLGWSHGQAKEILTHDELIADFDPSRFSKSSSKFDIKKMEWFSKEYIKHMPNRSVAKGMIYNAGFLPNNEDKTQNIKLIADHFGKLEEWMDMFIETYKQSAITYSQLNNSIKIYESDEVREFEKNEVTEAFGNELLKVNFTPEGIQEAINSTKELTGEKGKNLFMPIRAITTYQEHGPELAKAIYLVGKSVVEARLK